MRQELSDILSRNRPELVENIDPEHGILNDLLAMGVLTRRQVKSIEVLLDPFRMVESLLDMLRRRPDEDFDKFREVLCKHGQEEVVEHYLKLDSSASGLGAGASEREQESNIAVATTKTLVNPEVETTSAVRVQNTTPEFYHRFKDMAYPMCNAHRGKCYIFNVNIVHGMERRQGSEEDLQNVKALFQQLHFITDTFTNPTAKDMIDKIAEIARDPGLDQDQCIVLFFLSHGRIVPMMTKQGIIAVEYIYGSDGQQVATETITEPLTNNRCPAMRGKPKLLFFQACREYSKHEFEQNSSSVTHTDALPGLADSESSSASVPAASATSSSSFSSSNQSPISLKDFVIGYSTESGYPSFRNTQSGSWYISAIANVFSQHAHEMDLCAMLRKVNGMITLQKPVGTAVDNRLSQVASHVDSLTKPYLYFFPGIIDGCQ